MPQDRILQITPPLSSLLEVCEVHCVAACCQDDAFDCGVEQIARWTTQETAEAAFDARTQASALLKEVELDPDSTGYTELFMAHWRPSELARLLQEVVTSLDVLLRARLMP